MQHIHYPKLLQLGQNLQREVASLRVKDFAMEVQDKVLRADHQVRQLRGLNGTLSGQVKSFADENADLSKGKVDLEARVEQLTGELNESKTEAARLESEVSARDRGLNAKDRTIAALQSELTSLRTELKESNNKSTSLEKEKDDLAKQTQHLEDREEELCNVVHTYKTTIEGQSNTITTLEGELSKLQERLEKEQETARQDRVGHTAAIEKASADLKASEERALQNSKTIATKDDEIRGLNATVESLRAAIEKEQADNRGLEQDADKARCRHLDDIAERDAELDKQHRAVEAAQKQTNLIEDEWKQKHARTVLQLAATQLAVNRAEKRNQKLLETLLAAKDTFEQVVISALERSNCQRVKEGDSTKSQQSGPAQAQAAEPRDSAPADVITVERSHQAQKRAADPEDDAGSDRPRKRQSLVLKMSKQVSPEKQAHME
ncbi:uncharacterized protein AB675_4882 [Cyphellophora attinorum]|uniref:Uncharacterized protein n=1 Tax=Cyphellophora attinorum TaxID=1664694 RepID=A0A0N0NHY7_9EURO|nr:uncharacterized protein AB675_4882 [Phialophora attinorum]KPI34829.1 hypothetical protein AB675_4882 [Phialophora attinorum]